jgi:hypothetical protein
MTSSAPEPEADARDEHPGTSPDDGRVEAEEMDGDSDGGDSRQQQA